MYNKEMKQLQTLYKTHKEEVKTLIDLYAKRYFLLTNPRGGITAINLEKVDNLIKLIKKQIES